MGTSKKVFLLARLGEKGRLTIPAEYQRAHRLGRGSALVMVELGDALVLVPSDEALAFVAARHLGEAHFFRRAARTRRATTA
jgi:bifunctional DNA-binding transcriptional regulator/antitoxin component of YhaV-PrlF toxin-antitoxin module